MTSDHIYKWEAYRDSRVGTYEFRARTRYKAVAECLRGLGLRDGHTVLDVGAGTCQFGRYLRQQEWAGLYIPVDAVLDGVDLERWPGTRPVDFVVSIEVLEHVKKPERLLTVLTESAARGVVITTPNPEAVDVLKCDPTHVSVVRPEMLASRYFRVERHSWFGVPNDTLLAWRSCA